MTPLAAALAALNLAAGPGLDIRLSHGSRGSPVWMSGCLRGSVETLDESEMVDLRVEIAGLRGRWSASVDEDDEFFACGLLPGVYRVYARGVGMEPATSWVVVTDRLRRREIVDLELRREGSVDVVVQVLDPEGRGVPRTSVTLAHERLEDGYWFAETDGLGRAVFRGTILPGTEVWVSTSHEDFDGQLESNGTIGRGGGPQFVLRFEAPPWSFVEAVAGRLVEENDRPVAGARVTTWEIPRHASGFHEGTTDRDGRFRFAHVREGAYGLRVEAADRPVEVLPLLVQPGLGPVTVRLSSPTRVRGRIVGAPDGERATAVFARPPNIEFCRDNGGQFITWSSAEGLRPRSQDGRLTENGYDIALADGIWMIQAKAEHASGQPGWKWSANALVEVSGQGELTVDLQAGPADASRMCKEIGFPIPPDRVVPARIVDATSGEPIEGVEIRTSLGKWTSAATGELELHFLPRRAETLRIGTAGGWLSMRMEVATPPEGVLEIPLRRTVACRVRVLDPLGIPLRFMPSIRLRDVTGHEFRLEGIASPLGVDLDCPEGVFELELVTGRGRYVHPEPVTIPGLEIVVRLPPAGGLDLRVPELEIEYDEDWLDGVEVVLEPLDDQASEPLVRRDDLYLNGLPVGRYWVRVAAPDGRRWEGGAEVRDDEVRTVMLW